MGIEDQDQTKQKRTWLTILIILLVLLGACLACSIGGVVLFERGARSIYTAADQASQEIRDPLDGYLQAMGREDVDSALSYFIDSQQTEQCRQILLDQLEAQPDSYQGYLAMHVQNFSVVYNQQATADLSGTLEYEDGRFRQFEAHLVRPSSTWQLTSVSIDPTVYDSQFGSQPLPDWMIQLWEQYGGILQKWLEQ